MLKTSYSIAFLRDEVARILDETIEYRRASQRLIEGDYDELFGIPPDNSPVTEYEIDEFLAQCPLSMDELTPILLEAALSLPDQVTLSDNELLAFLSDIEAWSNSNTWVGGDEWPAVLDGRFYFTSKEFLLTRRTRYTKEELASPETRLTIARLSPSFRILEKLLENRINLDNLHWREFEELVAEMLQNDGYEVQLGPGRDDGGKDIIAVKELQGVGPIMSVWQAKKQKRSNKVGLQVIRELADTRNEHKASKGIIVTTTFLTRGALERVRRDQYLLGKVDRDDLMKWIDAILRGQRG